MKSMVFLVFLGFFNIFALVVYEIHGLGGFSLFFQCFCFGSGLGALERFGDLWEAPGCSRRLWDALGGGSVRLVKGQMLSLNHQPLTLNPQPIHP